MSFLYFDCPHAILVHDEIIERSGGLKGLLNIGLLESTLEHVQNDNYYPCLEDKVTYLFYSINKNHAFQDGNKRSSIALMSYFLEINNCDFAITRSIQELENIAVDVANNVVDRELLFEIIKSLLYESEYNEELQIKIFRAKMEGYK